MLVIEDILPCGYTEVDFRAGISDRCLRKQQKLPYLEGLSVCIPHSHPSKQ